MTVLDLDQHADEAVGRTAGWMDASRLETSLLQGFEHHGAPYEPHETFPALERAATDRGLYLHYIGAMIGTYDGDEPYYYLLLSRKPELSPQEIRVQIPGYRPIFPAAA